MATSRVSIEDLLQSLPRWESEVIGLKLNLTSRQTLPGAEAVLVAGAVVTGAVGTDDARRWFTGFNEDAKMAVVEVGADNSALIQLEVSVDQASPLGGDLAVIRADLEREFASRWHVIVMLVVVLMGLSVKDAMRVMTTTVPKPQCIHGLVAAWLEDLESARALWGQLVSALNDRQDS